MKAYLNASEVAKLLNVDRATVSRWLNKGLIPQAVRMQGSSGGSQLARTRVSYVHEAMKVISFSIFKGGTGKTTSSVNTAVVLAKRGKQVLLVDLDQ